MQSDAAIVLSVSLGIKNEMDELSIESPEVEELFKRIVSCLPQATPYRSTAFRSAGVKYANETDFLSGEGASYYGGRWNPPGVKAIYASSDPVTAVRESYQEFMKYGFSQQDIKPRVMAGIELQLDCLLDLSETKIRRKIGFGKRFLLE